MSCTTAIRNICWSAASARRLGAAAGQSCGTIFASPEAWMSRIGSALVAGSLIAIVVACDREPRRMVDASSQTRASEGAGRADAVAAAQQPPTEADQEMGSSIRRAIVEDDSLSATAKKVTVVSVNAVVTLRGRVDGSSEKQLIASIARRVPGVRRVDDQVGVVLR
jgi:hypothetical protein